MSKKSVIIKTAVIVVCCAAVIGGAVFGVKYFKSKSASSVGEIKLDTVTRGNIETVISGSAAVEPLERYEIIPLVNGTIISCSYEVGDVVSKDDVLYQFDSSELDISLKKAENDFEKTTISRNETLKDTEKLIVTAPCSGVISGLTAKAGDKISNGSQLAQIKDTVNLEVDIPFTAAQMNYISLGSPVDILSSEHMSGTKGVVTHINNVSTAQEDGSVLYYVTVSLVNPGAFGEGLKVSAQINGMVSPYSGEIRCVNEQTVKTEIEGNLSELYMSNGDYVNKGDVIAVLTSETLTNSIKKNDLEYDNARLSLRDSYDKLDDYIIKSPINGTVITKNSKAGDTVDRSNSSVTMMVIADVSKLKFSLEIDELDVIKVKEGMEVDITCDAVENTMFKGYISNVSVEGSSSDGVTTYKAEVIIDEPGELRPSMNVDASVIIESAENVLMLPVTDVKTAGNRKYVFTPVSDSQDKNSKDKSEDKREFENSGIPGNGSDRQRRENADGPDNRRNENAGDPDSRGREAGAGGNESAAANGNPGRRSADGAAPGENPNMPDMQNRAGRSITAPDGFEATFVETGISSEDYIEIKSGLNEGDMVYKQETSSSRTNNMMQGGMGGPGGMGGMGGPGGAPGGSMGGRPGGGMR
ncbi:MAG: efflux RND transporter periplasmic adaptor subunit [Oscillospiraceae bacterium]|nr:efflux RND transporter periplasmic adaptor subunit [Oscillospiraceae bacterium]